VFDLRNCYAVLCQVLAGLICAVNKVVALFPELKKLFLDCRNHSSGPQLSGQRDCLNPMSSEITCIQ
jgi:hypothetical protein